MKTNLWYWYIKQHYFLVEYNLSWLYMVSDVISWASQQQQHGEPSNLGTRGRFTFRVAVAFGHGPFGTDFPFFLQHSRDAGPGICTRVIFAALMKATTITPWFGEWRLPFCFWDFGQRYYRFTKDRSILQWNNVRSALLKNHSPKSK